MKLVFDFGGVVFHWVPAQLLREVLPARTATAEATKTLVDGIFQSYGGDWAEFDRGVLEPDALAVRVARRTGLTEAEVHRVIDAVPHALQPNPETVALLHELKAGGHRLYYLSNMPAPYAEHLEHTHAFLRWFEDGLFSARIKLAKPDPAIFVQALARFGGSAEQCVFFDDHAGNIDTARSLGWTARQFTTAAQARADLIALGVLAARPGAA